MSVTKRRAMSSKTPVFLPTQGTTTDVFCGTQPKTRGTKYNLFGQPTTIEEWPPSCDELCWHCCHGFTTVPASIPMHQTGGQWSMKGVFCSWECAKRYVVDLRLYNHAAVLFQLKAVAADFGVTERIEAAPPRTMLRAFGGTLSIDDFRQQNKVFCTIEAPFYNHSMAFKVDEKVDTSIRGLRRPSSRKQPSKSSTTSLYAQFLQSNVTPTKPKKTKKRKQTKIDGGMGAFLKVKRKKGPAASLGGAE